MKESIQYIQIETIVVVFIYVSLTATQLHREIAIHVNCTLLTI